MDIVKSGQPCRILANIWQIFGQHFQKSRSASCIEWELFIGRNLREAQHNALLSPGRAVPNTAWLDYPETEFRALQCFLVRSSECCCRRFLSVRLSEVVGNSLRLCLQKQSKEHLHWFHKAVRLRVSMVKPSLIDTEMHDEGNLRKNAIHPWMFFPPMSRSMKPLHPPIEALQTAWIQDLFRDPFSAASKPIFAIHISSWTAYWAYLSLCLCLRDILYYFCTSNLAFLKTSAFFFSFLQYQDLASSAQRNQYTRIH